MSYIPLIFNSSFSKFTLDLLSSKTLSSKLKTLLSFRLNFLTPRFALKEALTDPTTGLSMGETGEILAKEFAISREDQDRFTIESHQKAFQGRDKLKEEMFPVFPDPYYKPISRDTGVRENISFFKIAKSATLF